MEDSEHVCPLCCEELDISDQQFFPCKCGYQVCMWCWHRIREQESGLCPACRTAYGDDPHEFSAVDVQEVLKANKEKEAAAKRERDRQRQQQGNVDGLSAGSALISGAGSGDDGGELTGIMEVPKDRTQLANMRVIRRNLVYAVGLPPTIANEDVLKKPDYFGQYGKIAKIVLNRNQASNGDPRRASCSAYVTFVHKEDTLACILALDGFYLENRNVRASYGTSKYCSAFIKNVRCNNPECTYLHEMGAVEDTFTKQEIQAGYVTSGRDVLARQQQIVQQALSASQGAAGTTPRRRIGGGGPSGTGRSSSNPIFPAPEFDEPAKPAPTLVPAPNGMSRAASTGAQFPTVAQASQQAMAKPISRSASVGTTSKASATAAIQGAARKTDGHPQGATAASVVAGVHSISGSGGIGSTVSPHTTLTPLTPLKRASKTSTSVKPPASTSDSLNTPALYSSNGFPKPHKATVQRASSKNSTDSIRATTVASKTTGTPPSPGLSPPRASVEKSPAMASLNPPDQNQQQPSSLSSLGGEVIVAPERSKVPGPIGSPFGASCSGGAVGVSALNGYSDGSDNIITGKPAGLSGLGGEVFNGPLTSSSAKTAIGGGKDKWSGAGSAPGHPIGSPGGLWGDTAGSSGFAGVSGSGIGAQGGTIGGGVIGSHGAGPGFSNGMAFGATSGPRNSGSSALASILGINLPTGSGSLNESTNLWPQTSQHPHPAAAVSSLQGTPLPSQGVIGRTSGGSGSIGGVPIGGNPIGLVGSHINQQGAIGSNKNDIALLQSLLPEVHITSGNGAPSSNWNSPGPQHQPAVGIGANMTQHAQPQGAAGNIW